MSENYMKKVQIFLNNFFIILLDFYKINFGYLYNLNIYSKENKENMDLGFFIEMQIYLFRFFNLLKKKFVFNNLSNNLSKYTLNYNNFLNKIILLNKHKKKLRIK
jgi:hypothetical protein